MKIRMMITLIYSYLSVVVVGNTSWDSFITLAGCHKGQTSPGLSKLKTYLRHFGYLDAADSSGSDAFDASLEAAVKTYQLNFNLKPTGQLDVPTLAHIARPRCGCPDLVNGSSIHAVAHYSFFPDRPRWPPGKTNLTYAFLPANNLSSEVRAVFAVAFGRWAAVAPLAFREVAAFGRADIRIGFHRGEHGDGEPFDGPLKTLAHAFAPPNGRLHMDGEERWVMGGNGAGVDLESVAVHEIGHVLGLGHSSHEEAIMYPSISSGERKVELRSDDIMGVQHLYGSNPNYNASDTLSPRGARDTSTAPPSFISPTKLTASFLLLTLFF